MHYRLIITASCAWHSSVCHHNGYISLATTHQPTPAPLKSFSFASLLLLPHISRISLYIFPICLLKFRLVQAQKKVILDDICAIFKTGDRGLPKTYLPISFTYMCCKIIEHVLCHFIVAHLDKSNILINSQHGCMHG